MNKKLIDIEQDYKFICEFWKIYKSYAEELNGYIKRDEVPPDDFWLNWIKESQSELIDGIADDKLTRGTVIAAGAKLDYAATWNGVIH